MSWRHRFLWFSVSGLLMSATAWAYSPEDAAQAEKYNACIAQIESAPNQAFNAAMSWRDLGGGAPARHCEALALLELGHPEEAALRLEALAHRGDAGEAEMRAELLAQSANAWMLANDPNAALAVLGEALRLNPASAELHLDRAAALLAMEDWPRAEAAAGQALAYAPRSATAYLLRAKARLASNGLAGAAADVRLALRYDPENIDARVLRGELRQLGAM